ncbi:MAG: hypothetical protein J7453_06090 [Thermomicrobium sp.]|jgi:hypothetical protein|nr:hypothetical protein [Thermomicrobium sp.]
MWSFPALQLVSFALVVLSVRAIVRAWRARHQLFAEPVTAQQLAVLVELALFVLVPISVLAHELGHAVAVWLSGGRVIGFGYLLFLGWVEYTGVTNPIAQFWIASSGNLVSLFLALVAIGAGLFAPLRRPVAALLLTAGGMILATTLVFYPALDLASGLQGDWTQLYSGPRSAALVLGVLHGALLLTGFAVWRSRWLRWRVSARIGRPWRLDEHDRRLLAWRQLAETAEELGKHDASLAVSVQENGGRPELHLSWRGAKGQRSLRARIGERPDVLEVEALAGQPPALRASWRALVPPEALFAGPSPFPALLHRLRAAADALEPVGEE